MKKFYTFLILALFSFNGLHSQIHIFLEEQTISLIDFQSSAWVFPIAHNLELALEDFQAYSKERSSVKLKKDGSNVVIGQKLSIPAISSKRADLVAHTFISETYYGMAVIFQLG